MLPMRECPTALALHEHLIHNDTTATTSLLPDVTNANTTPRTLPLPTLP